MTIVFTTKCDHDGPRKPGEVVAVTETVARRLIRLGVARIHEMPKPETKKGGRKQ